MSWRDLERDAPELAEFGRRRLAGNVSYLATVRADGSPRVHPVTPIIGEGRLFVFMEPTSPKGKDLERDARFALHCGVADTEGGEGEFIVSGRAVRVTDDGLREQAVRSAGYAPADRYILFELHPEQAQSTVYSESGPVRHGWRAAK